jgi:hypothetical protein
MGPDQFFFAIVEIDFGLIVNQCAYFLEIIIRQIDIAGKGLIGIQVGRSPHPPFNLSIYLEHTSTIKFPALVLKGMERMGPLMICFTSCPGPETTEGIDP